MQNNLVLLSQVFEQVTDPRGKQGREHPLSGLLQDKALDLFHNLKKRF